MLSSLKDGIISQVGSILPKLALICLVSYRLTPKLLMLAQNDQVYIISLIIVFFFFFQYSSSLLLVFFQSSSSSPSSFSSRLAPFYLNMLTSYSRLLHFLLLFLTSCLSFCRFDLIHGSLHGWSASFPFVLLQMECLFG